MKVFFLASISVTDELRKQFKKIVQILESEGNIVQAEQSLDLPQYIVGMDKVRNQVRAKSMLKEMLQCDCVVFEGTKPTTGGGYYLYAALQRSIPVLYLTQEEYKGLFLASSNRLLRIKQYSATNPLSLIEIIQDFLRFTVKKRLGNRFNLMISDSMDNYLNKISKEYGISKADFIRDLIYQKMEED